LNFAEAPYNHDKQLIARSWALISHVFTERCCTALRQKLSIATVCFVFSRLPLKGFTAGPFLVTNEEIGFFTGRAKLSLVTRLSPKSLSDLSFVYNPTCRHEQKRDGTYAN